MINHGHNLSCSLLFVCSFSIRNTINSFECFIWTLAY